jgi:regulator of sigma E protease
MKLIIQIGQLLLSLSILIILHELGHFLFARLFRTRVEKFYLFFDPWFSLFKVKKGDTEYGIGWLPLGGYVKISGMIDESMDKEQLKQPPQPYEFRSKPAWQRLLIMLGGVMVNLLLGFIIFTFILFTYGDKYLPNKNITDGLLITDSIMLNAGLRTGDKVISINGFEPDNYTNILEEMLYGGTMVIERNGKDTTILLAEDFAGQLADYRIHNDNGILFYPRVPFIVADIPDTSINVHSGLKSLDRLVELDGVPVKYNDQVPLILDTIRNKTIPVSIERDGKRMDLKVKISDRGMMEITYPSLLTYDEMEKLGVYQFATHEFTFFQSIPAGFQRAKKELLSYMRQFKLIFNFKTGAYKAVGGFGAITNLFPPQWHWEAFWTITAIISIMLAFLNILPIPALDGGHVAFLFYEIITGRKPGDKFLEYAQIIGMALLFFLLIYANGNDVYRWILRLIGK